MDPLTAPRTHTQTSGDNATDTLTFVSVLSTVSTLRRGCPALLCPPWRWWQVPEVASAFHDAPRRYRPATTPGGRLGFGSDAIHAAQAYRAGHRQHSEMARARSAASVASNS